MSDRKRTAESNSGLAIGPQIQPHYPFPFVLPVETGPARQGPGDHWRIPSGPLDEIEGRDAAPEPEPAPAQPGRAGGLLHRLIRRG
jgi:hypothetical protein